MSRLRTRMGLNRFAPRLESLDDRVVPSCTVSLDAGVLRIEGDQQSNTIEIVDDGTTVTVTCDDGTSEEFTDVTEIEVRGGNGQDVVSYDLTIAEGTTEDPAVAVERVVDVKLGNGVDSFTGSVEGTLLEGSAVDVSVKGCNGKDAIGFDVAGDVNAGATLDVLLKGGNGKDEVLSSYAGVLLGDLTWELVGGNGKDTLTAGMTFDEGSTGTADVDVKGERAPDFMTLLVTDNTIVDDGDPNTEDVSTLGESSFTVYGGLHPDQADVTEGIVEVLSAKEV